MRIRQDQSANYRAVFLDSGKTIRFKQNQSQPFGVPKTPEIEDVAINNRCLANCSYCYTDAKSSGVNFDKIVEKAHMVWGQLPIEERPFQIAIGGAGESTMHPDWCDFVREVKSLGIVPNYTTNGMHLSDEILNETERSCGGVALSWHPHIAKVFHRTVEQFKSIKTRLNFHITVGDETSLTDLIDLHNQYSDIVEYFVILPYQAAGRAPVINVENVWKKCFNWIKSVDPTQFAFGALFYKFLKSHEVGLPMSIYEPEIFSGYRIMDDSYNLLRKSSYDLQPKTAFGNFARSYS